MRGPEGNVAGAANGAASGRGDSADSLLSETRAAAGAMAEHIRNVTATAKTEAELSAASLVTAIAAALVSLLLVVTAWLCVVAAAVWMAIDSGLSVAAALLIAGAIHIALVIALLLWGKSLFRNIGFARTRQLVFPQSRGSR